MLSELLHADAMFCKFYYLYQKSPWSLELRELSEAYNKTEAKPSEATGTHWIDHKYGTMEHF